MILLLVFCIFLPFKDLNMLIFLEVEGKKNPNIINMQIWVYV